MTATASELKAKYTEFAATLDATVTTALTDAAGMMSTAFFGSQYDEAQMLLACHILKLREDIANGLGGGAGGAVVAESLDGWSATYSRKGMDNSAFAAWAGNTTYGQQFLAYRAQGVRVFRMG